MNYLSGKGGSNKLLGVSGGPLADGQKGGGTHLKSTSLHQQGKKGQVGEKQKKEKEMIVTKRGGLLRGTILGVLVRKERDTGIQAKPCKGN